MRCRASAAASACCPAAATQRQLLLPAAASPGLVCMLLHVCEGCRRRCLAPHAGALSIVAASSSVASRLESQLKAIIRPMYSSPPIHGAALVTTILSSPQLRGEWEVELRGMAQRIRRVRKALHLALQQVWGLFVPGTRLGGGGRTVGAHCHC